MAALKSDQTTRADIERKFREELGRDLTPEEKHMLGWANDALTFETVPVEVAECALDKGKKKAVTKITYNP